KGSATTPGPRWSRQGVARWLRFGLSDRAGGETDRAFSLLPYDRQLPQAVRKSGYLRLNRAGFREAIATRSGVLLLLRAARRRWRASVVSGPPLSGDSRRRANRRNGFPAPAGWPGWGAPRWRAGSPA